MSQVSNRKEIVFLYDCTNVNPNGDPNDENKPRMDEEAKKCIVSDSRLKRTIRDHMKDQLGKTIFVWTELVVNTKATKEEEKEEVSE